MACQAETAHLVPAGTAFVHSVEALTLRDMLLATGTMENGGVLQVPRVGPRSKFIYSPNNTTQRAQQ
eukprot:230947-Prymnesium_polylepis.1